MGKSTVYYATGLKVRYEVVEKALLTIYNAAIEGKGLFHGGYDFWKRRYLPQWRIPKEFEFSPPKDETRFPLQVAKFLWRSINFERQARSDFLERQLHAIWVDPDKRWFFDDYEILKRGPAATQEILENDLHYTIKARPNTPLGQTVHSNARLMCEKYDSDPRNLINGQTVEQARQNHMQFGGIGTGISNLNIIHFMDRMLATPTDPENILWKIDTHKARMPFNVDAIELPEGVQKAHLNGIVPTLEKAYRDICAKNELNPRIADAAVWIIGSLGCAKADDRRCHQIRCPIYAQCVTNTPMDQDYGTMLVFDERGKRIDKNENEGFQPHPEFGVISREVYDAGLVEMIDKKRNNTSAKPVTKGGDSLREDNQLGLFVE